MGLIYGKLWRSCDGFVGGTQGEAFEGNVRWGVKGKDIYGSIYETFKENNRFEEQGEVAGEAKRILRSLKDQKHNCKFIAERTCLKDGWGEWKDQTTQIEAAEASIDYLDGTLETNRERS